MKDDQMQYMLMFYENEAEVAAQRDTADRSGPYWDAWNAYMGALYPSGIVLRGDALLPNSAATTVRLENGKRLVQDGPVAATKEQLAGYVVIEVPDLDTRCPGRRAAPRPPMVLLRCGPCWICLTKAKQWTSVLKTMGGGQRRMLLAPHMGVFSLILRENGET
jgi:hypothetical protein